MPFRRPYRDGRVGRRRLIGLVEASSLALAAALIAGSPPAFAQSRDVPPPLPVDSSHLPELRQPQAATPPAWQATPELAPLSAEDRIVFNAGLDALVLGDIEQARGLFLVLARDGETPASRSAAALIVDRLEALEKRSSSGLVPAPRAGLLGIPRLRATVAAPAPAAPRNMRGPVTATSTIFGLAAWGWLLPTAIGLTPDDHTRGFLGVYMLTAAASFFVPYYVTRERPTDAADLNAFFYGGSRGAELGLLLSGLAAGQAGGDFDGHTKVFSASLLAGSIGGALGGVALTRRLGLSAGDVRTIGVLGDYGLFFGFGLGHMLGFDELQEDGRPALDARTRSMAGAGLAGSGLGLLGGRLLSLRRDNTWGDGEVMRAAGAIGVLASASLGLAFDVDDSRGLVGLMLAGGGLGLWSGDRFVRGRDFTFTEAVIVDFSVIVGGLGGAGITYLLHQSDEPAPYLIAGFIGALASGALVAVTFTSEERATQNRRNLSWQLMPQLARGRPTGLNVVGAF